MRWLAICLSKTFRAAGSLDIRSLLVTGGVAANRELRARFTAEAAARNLPIAFPSLALSTDNAAMIAAAAWPKFVAQDFAAPSLNAEPSLAAGPGLALRKTLQASRLGWPEADFFD